jgi:class 3 adenylate cyclase/predicted ATPase
VSSAERRHLTVMFCDLVGSTMLSARLDLEDLQEVIRAYQKEVADVVARFGGFVARRVGDGALIYFGYPHADEDGPEQSIRAGLALVEAMARLKGQQPLQVRIGIATGLVVVVGDLIGTGSGRELEVLGEGPNLAARLQALAGANSIVIADSTRQLVGSVFELEDLGARELKGFGAPQRAWRVIGEARFTGRFEALRRAETPFIGRSEEIELLLRRWAQAKTGEGRIVLLAGEPGIGKSRLTVTLSDLLGTEPHTCLRYFCSPHHQDSALFPVIVQLEQVAGFERDDAPEAKLGKLEALVAATSQAMDDVACLADLLSLPGGRDGSGASPPWRKKEDTFAALLRYLAALAQQRPVLLIFEDLQWIDPTSRELLDHLVEQVEHLPVLLIATFRPEFHPPWASQSYFAHLTLNRISRRESETLVGRLTAATPLPSEFVEEIVERCDGVPLFLEEVTKGTVELGHASTRGAVHDMRGPPLSVPPTLHASLLTRLDRLGAMAKEIAQIGAAIGREFSYELLLIVAQRPEPELKEKLAQLIEAGLVFRRGELPRSDFRFKHALVQDAAYSTLPRGPRQKLHARVAQALEDAFPDIAENRPQLIARHLSEAGLGERATLYWQRAGELALRRSSVGEAVMHFSSGLRILETMAHEPETSRRELEIRLGLGTALNIAYGSSAPPVAEHYARAVTLARQLGVDKQLFRAVWGSWYTNLTTGQAGRSLALANELVEVAEKLADQDLILEAHHSRWGALHISGLISATLADTERGIALYHPDRHHVHAYEYGGHDTGVCAHAHRAVTLWIAGLPEQAARTSLAALELGGRLGHPPSLAHAAWWSATLRQLLREPQACRELAEMTMRIAHEQGSRIFVMCPLLLGWTLFETGKVSEGLQRMDEAVTVKRQRIVRFYYDYELLVFAEALLKAGELSRAQEILEEALNFIEVSGNRLFEAEAKRLKAVCLMASEGAAPGEAESWLLGAIETAERQGALSFALRAAMSLAQAWRDVGRPSEAHGVLAGIYERFTEGLETPDLIDARALLNSLQPAHGSQ